MFDFGWFFNGRFVYLDNPLIVAVIIVVAVMIIFYFINYEYVEISELVRTGIYSAIVVYGILSLHYRNISLEFEEKTEKVTGGGLVAGVAGTVTAGNLQPNIQLVPYPVPMAMPASPITVASAATPIAPQG